MKTVLKTLSDVSLREAREVYGSGASTMNRGIYYEHQNNPQVVPMQTGGM